MLGVLVMMCVVSALSACDEDASSTFVPAGSVAGDAAPDTTPGSTPVTDTTNVFNGGLAGTLMNTISSNNEPLLFDLSTGRYSRHEALFDIQAGLTEHGFELYNSRNMIAFNRAAPNAGFIQTYGECVKTGSISEENVSYRGCVVIYNADGSRRGSLVSFNTMDSPAKLSPDGRFFAMNDYYEGIYSPAESYIEIRQSSDAKEVEHTLELDATQYYNGKAVVEWGASGEIFYTNSADATATVYVTAPYTLNTVQTIELTGYPGEIETLDISPDGRKLLIGYDPAALNAVGIGSVFILDLETLKLTVPAIDYRDSGQRPLGDEVIGDLRHPAWSPDGKWILVMHGHNDTPVDYIDPNARPAPPEPSGHAVVRMYAVPADGEYAELGLDSVSPDAMLLFNYVGNPEIVSDRWAGGKVFWLK